MYMCVSSFRSTLFSQDIVLMYLAPPLSEATRHLGQHLTRYDMRGFDTMVSGFSNFERENRPCRCMIYNLVSRVPPKVPTLDSSNLRYVELSSLLVIFPN
eukprot:Rmarinus@m.8998